MSRTTRTASASGNRPAVSSRAWAALALDELHDQEVPAGVGVLAGLEALDDVRVRQELADVGLAAESVHVGGVLRQVVGQDLDRDRPAPFLVVGQVDLGHPAGPEPAQQPVAADARERRGGRLDRSAAGVVGSVTGGTASPPNHCAGIVRRTTTSHHAAGRPGPSTEEEGIHHSYLGTGGGSKHQFHSRVEFTKPHEHAVDSRTTHRRTESHSSASAKGSPSQGKRAPAPETACRARRPNPLSGRAARKTPPQVRPSGESTRTGKTRGRSVSAAVADRPQDVAGEVRRAAGRKPWPPRRARSGRGRAGPGPGGTPRGPRGRACFRKKSWRT